MALEGGTYIDDFVITNPTGADDRSTADDHLRLIKAFIKATFPNITGAMNATQVELNYVVGVTSLIQTQLDAKQATDAGLDDIAALAVTDGNFIVGDGTNWVAEAPAAVRTSLGLGALALLATADTAEIEDGAITRDKIRPSITGTNLVLSTGGQSTISSTYVKVAEIMIPASGVLSVAFTLAPTYSANPAFGRIYVNGVATGTERTTTNVSGVTYTEDISGLAAGDLIQIYSRLTNPGSEPPYPDTCSVSPIEIDEGIPWGYTVIL